MACLEAKGSEAGLHARLYIMQSNGSIMRAAAARQHPQGISYFHKVTAHTGCSKAAKIGVRAGLDCIEHGYELDDEACE